MFVVGEQETAAKAAVAGKRKSRRVSVAGQFRNDENVMPSTPRGHGRGRGLAGNGSSFQTQQAFLQAATKPSAPGASPALTTPSSLGPGGGGGGGGAAATQMVNQNFELMRRQQELGTVLQSYEATNGKLQEQNKQLLQQVARTRADAERAAARADGACAEVVSLRSDLKAARAEVTSLRQDAETAGTEIAGLRRDADAARDEAARSRAEAEAATARAETAELAQARTARELERVKEAAAKAEDAARKAARALKAEAAKVGRAHTAASAADKAAAIARAAAAADIAAAAQDTAVANEATGVAIAAAASAAAANAASQAGRESSQRQQPGVTCLAASLETLAMQSSPAGAAASFDPKAGKKRGRGCATPGAAGRGRYPTTFGGGPVDPAELTKGFCRFVAAYTAQDLPLDALRRLLEAAPSSVGQKQVAEADDDWEGTRPPPQSAAVESAGEQNPGTVDQSVSPEPVPAAAAATTLPTFPAAVAAAVGAAAVAKTVEVTTPESTILAVKPTTSRREMLDARKAQQKERDRIQEEQERVRVERQREARQKRRKEAARQKAVEEAAARNPPVGEAVPDAAVVLSSTVLRLQRQEQQQQQQQQQQGNAEKIQKQPREAEGRKEVLRVRNVKSRRAKHVPTQQQKKQQQQLQAPSEQPPPQQHSGGTAASGDTHVSADSAGEQQCFTTTAFGAKVVQPLKEAGALRTASATAAPAKNGDNDEMAGVVEEVPMPTGDIDDGFFCSDFGMGGGGGGGLVVGGGEGSGRGGYEVASHWSFMPYGSPCASESSTASDAARGEKSKKGRGRPRKVVAVAECAKVEGSAETENSGVGESSEGGDGVGGKKKRRRSMRPIRAPIKFGSEEFQALGAPSNEPNQDHPDRPAPKLETLGDAATSGVDHDSRCVVAPAPTSRTRPTNKDNAAAAVAAAAGSSAARIAPAARCVGVQHHALPAKRRTTVSAFNPKRENIRTVRARAGGLSAAAAAAHAATAAAAAASAAPPPPPPPLAPRPSPAAAASAASSASATPSYGAQAWGTSDSSAAVAAAEATGTEAATWSKNAIFSTAAVAKRAVESLFDTVALELSTAKQGLGPAAATTTASDSKVQASRGAGEGEGLPAAGGARVCKPKPKPAVAPVAMECVLPFGSDITDGVCTRDIVEAASSRSWLSGGRAVAAAAAMEGPRGALTAALATAQVLMDKYVRVAGSGSFSPVLPEEMRHLDSLLTAIVATEACAMRHELQAAAEAGETASVGVGGQATAAVAAPAAGREMAKRVRFCAFDLSTVDMPSEAIQDSDLAAKEVSQCLARVAASSKLILEALLKRGGGSGAGGGLAAVLEAIMRGLKTVAAVDEPWSSPLVAGAQAACHEFGGEVSPDVIRRAAAFLLESMQSLGSGAEVAARCPLKRRLATMLSALIRYNLRILLNPPPPKSVSSLYIADSTDRPRKVYEVIQLVSDNVKPANKRDVFDPSRDETTSAVVSRALRRLYGFTDRGAVEVIAAAEAFVASTASWNDLSGRDKTLEARRHSRDTVDIVAAIRARNFLLELLEFPGVESAISQAQGWGELERLCTELRQVEDSPDADASLTLLGEVSGLKAWLRRDCRHSSPWRHDERAKAVLTRLDQVLVGCDKKEAKSLSQEARRRMWFPRVKSPKPLQESER